MAGLLDRMFATPSDQALFALGSGLLGVRRGNEGRAMMGALGAYNNAAEAQDLSQSRELQRQLIRSQLEDRQAKARAEAEAMLRRQRFLSELPNRLNMPLPGGPTIANAQAQGTIQPDMLIDAYQIGIKPDELRGLAGQTEVKDYKNVPGAAGPEVAGFDKWGNVKKTGQQAWVADLDPNVQRALDRRAALSASRTTVNAYEPFQIQLQRDMAKGLSGSQDALKDAPTAITNIRKAKRLVQQAGSFVGSFAEKKLDVVKFLNNNLGLDIDPNAVASAEELRSRVFFQIMDNLKKLDAQPSQLQQKTMMDSLGQLTTDPNALPRVLNAFEETLVGKVKGHNERARQFEERARQRDPQFQLPYDLNIQIPEDEPPAASEVNDLRRKRGLPPL